MKTIIKLSLEDQVLKATESPVIASGGVNENRIEFTFSEHWDNYTKVAVFSRTDDTADEDPIAIELLNNSCDVPFEVSEEEGTVLIGVFGILGNVTRTSTNIEYNIVKGSLLNGRAPATPTKNIYQQLLEKYTQLQTKAYNDFAGSILQSCSGEAILVTDSAERPLQGLRLFGKTTATEISEEVVVGTGKNLLPTPYADGDKTISGLTFTNTDGKLYLSGTATDAVTYNLGTVELEAGTYTLSRVESLAYDMFGIMWNIAAEGITVPEDYSGELSFSFTLSKKTYVSVSFDTWGGSDDAGVGVDGLGVDGYIQIQLEEGDTATEWEAYTEITETRTRTEYSNVGDSGSINVTITDGENSLTLEVSTPDGLAGLMLSDNAYNVGNETYIDADGKYIASDEVDFAKGVHIQRISRVVYDGSEDEDWLRNGNLFYVGAHSVKNRKYGGMIYASGHTYHRAADENGDCTVSDRLYFYNDTWSADTDPLARWKEYLAKNPMDVYYVLKTPIETPLSADEIEAFKALYTYYPNTTITNDSGAHMEVEYVADTKNYIDNKFAELSALLTSTNEIMTTQEEIYD